MNGRMIVALWMLGVVMALATVLFLPSRARSAS